MLEKNIFNNKIAETPKSINLLEVGQRLEELKSKFFDTNNLDEKNEIMEECRKLSALEIDQAATYEEILAAHFHSLHPEDRRTSYLKAIDLAPSKEMAQQLFYNALDDNIREIAAKRLTDFK